MTTLCDIAFKYGTDKCPQIKHCYTPFYYELLKDKEINKVLEIGVQWGNSLKMWRDFFPNAQIYGADIRHRRLFNEKNIDTFYCDQSDPKSLEELLEETGTNIDLFVDDGSHKAEHQIITAKTLLPLLQSGVIYIIEDVKAEGEQQQILKALSDYKCEVPDLPRKYHDDRLIIIRK